MVFNGIFRGMQFGYNDSWFKYLFRFTSLGQLLSNDTPPNAWEFFNTFDNSWWLTRIWFIFCFSEDCRKEFFFIQRALDSLKEVNLYNEANVNAISDARNPEGLVRALRDLNYNGLLNSENRRVVAGHINPEDLARALRDLNYNGLLNSENREVVADQFDPDSFVNMISRLHIVGILNAKNRQRIVPDDYSLAEVISTLHMAGILNQENFDVMVAHRNKMELAKQFSSFYKAGILNQENFDVMVAHRNQKELANQFSSFYNARMLNQENFDVMVAHSNPKDLAEALSRLKSRGILNSENRQLVAAHSNPKDLAEAFIWLNAVRILNSENRQLVAAHSYPNSLKEVFSELYWASILNQENFDIVVAHSNPHDFVNALKNLYRNNVKFILKGTYNHSIIIDTNHNNEYLRIKNLLPVSIQSMLIPSVYYDEREKALNQLVGYLLKDTLKTLPQDVIAYMLEFVQDDTTLRIEAMDIIKHIQLPQNLDSLDDYKKDLYMQVKEFTQVQDQLSFGVQNSLSPREQGLFLSLHKNSLWANRHSCPEAQQAFDRQHGLIVAS